MASARPSQDNIFTNKADCAKVLGISPRYLDEIQSTKDICKPNEYGAYDLKVVVPEYIASIKNSTDKSGLTEARKTLVEKQVEKTSIHIEIAKGNLHRAEDVKAITANMVAVTRSRLLEIPHKLAYKVMALKDIDAVKSTIQTEIYVALTSLAEYDPEQYFKRAKDFVVMGGGDSDGEEPEGDTE